MAKLMNQLLIFLFFLLINPLSSRSKSLARQLARGPDSLVLGLSRLGASSLPNPKPSTIRPTGEALNMLEPLLEIRDGFLISLNIGTPPQVIQVFMDTGSDLTWVPCGNLTFDCLDCDEYQYRNTKLMSTFSPFRSSTSYRDSCASPFCVDIHSSENYLDPCTISGCSLSTLIKGSCSRPCPSFSYTYGDGVVAGTLSRDTLRFNGPSSITREFPKFCFGCVGSTYHMPLGIAGFGRGELSFLSQLGFLQKGFSHCFLPFKYVNNPNITSPLLIGDLALSYKDNMQFTPMLKSPIDPSCYYIGLEAITVGNVSVTQVPLSLKEFDSIGNGGMLIDSGTTYTHLPKPIYSELLSILESLISYPRANETEERTAFDLCYKIPCPNNTYGDDHDLEFPPITFHFLNNVSLVLPQRNQFYAMTAPSNSTGVKCLMFQSMDDGDGGPAGVFGNFQQHNVEVAYDLENERIGFRPLDCASSAASYGLQRN